MMRDDPFGAVPVIPVLTIARIEDAIPLARALLAGGLTVLEVTLRTPAALDAIRLMASLEGAVVGAGTVLSADDAGAAIAAGARFLVSPGTSPALADVLAGTGVPSLPGCQTVSEALALRERGFRLLKFFPAAASGGTAWLDAVRGPCPDVRFVPTGGISLADAPRYLACPNVRAVGGSWMAPAALVTAGDFDEITTRARAAAAIRA